MKIWSSIRNRLLDWCLSKECVQIGELYERYNYEDCSIYDGDKLKFIGKSDHRDLLIETPSGIRNVSKLLKTVRYQIYNVRLDNGLSIECADTHNLIDENGDTVYVKDSIGLNIRTIYGNSKVVDVEIQDSWDNMYDISIDGDDHTYYTNGILSHNTTCAAAYFLWYASFKSNKTILVVSNKASNASEFIHRVRIMYSYLPKWLAPGITSDGWNKQSCAFDNNSRIISRATSESSARGLSLSLVFADELAFVRDNIQEEFWAALSPTLSTGGSLIVASTPDGDTNLFAKLAREAEAGIGEFKYIKYIWSAVPGRDEEWKQSEIARIGNQKFLQEHECVRLNSKATLISSLSLQQLVHPIDPINVLKEFKIWSEFKEGTKYIIGIDPATGTGGDFSVIEVFEFPSMIQAAEFRDNTTSSPKLYKALKAIIKFIERNGCEIYYSVENNGVGEGLLSLIESDENTPENAEFVTQENSNRPGFHTNNRAKLKAGLTFRDMIEDGSITILSADLQIELKNYIRTKNGYIAKSGATDDCISAVLIVIRILEEIIQYDDEAYSLMMDKLDGDYFAEDSYDENSTEGAAMPMVF